MTIEVKNCHECPLIKFVKFSGNYKCEGMTQEMFPPRDGVHHNCPLKTEPITVKIKEDE